MTNRELDLGTESFARIKVVGVGGGGGNAVNRMIEAGLRGVEFVVVNTDAQALLMSKAETRLRIGDKVTRGLGSGGNPAVGAKAAEESQEELRQMLEGSDMVFVTAGMGGGTGTGAAPVIAKTARDAGILTVAIVTIPFRNEGPRRINQALEGIAELEEHVDSLLVINNEKIREIHGNLKLSEAFSMADNVLAVAAKGIAEIITVHGFINVDFADVQTVMTNSGVAIMGTGTAQGEGRAIGAVKEALNSPLLNDTDIKGAKNILLNVISGTEEVTMDEIGQIIDYVKECSGVSTDLIWGNGVDLSLGEKISVTIIATGFSTVSIPELYARKRQINRIPLEEETSDPESEGTVFIVKDIPASAARAEIPAQRTIEFEIGTGSSEVFRNLSRIKKPVDSRKANERVNMIKRAQEELKDLKQAAFQTSDEIEELENTPAFKRKQMQIDPVKYSDETRISRYSLSDDEDQQVKLSKENPYLHGAVD